jgi:hypothetical protein
MGATISVPELEVSSCAVLADSGVVPVMTSGLISGVVKEAGGMLVTSVWVGVGISAVGGGYCSNGGGRWGNCFRSTRARGRC